MVNASKSSKLLIPVVGHLMPAVHHGTIKQSVLTVSGFTPAWFLCKCRKWLVMFMHSSPQECVCVWGGALSTQNISSSTAPSQIWLKRLISNTCVVNAWKLQVHLSAHTQAQKGSSPHPHKDSLLSRKCYILNTFSLWMLFLIHQHYTFMQFPIFFLIRLEGNAGSCSMQHKYPPSITAWKCTERALFLPFVFVALCCWPALFIASVGISSH